jgi:hypothetical protein
MTWTLIRSRSAAAVLFGLLAFGLASTVAGGSLQAGLAHGAGLAEAIAIRSPGARLDALLSTIKETRSPLNRMDRSRPRNRKAAPENGDDNVIAQLAGDKGSAPGLLPAADSALLASPEDSWSAVRNAPAIGSSLASSPFMATGPLLFVPAVPGPGKARPGEISRPPVVPEPGAWVMLILGFAIVGGRMRQQFEDTQTREDGRHCQARSH